MKNIIYIHGYKSDKTKINYLKPEDIDTIYKKVLHKLTLTHGKITYKFIQDKDVIYLNSKVGNSLKYIIDLKNKIKIINDNHIKLLIFLCINAVKEILEVEKIENNKRFTKIHNELDKLYDYIKYILTDNKDETQKKLLLDLIDNFIILTSNERYIKFKDKKKEELQSDLIKKLEILNEKYTTLKKIFKDDKKDINIYTPSIIEGKKHIKDSSDNFQKFMKIITELNKKKGGGLSKTSPQKIIDKEKTKIEDLFKKTNFFTA